MSPRYRREDSVTRNIAEQTLASMDACGVDRGHLLVFDRMPGTSWDAKIFRKENQVEGKTVVIWGM